MAVLQFILDHGLDILGALSLIITGIVAIAALIPGEQPDKFLKSVLDLITKFSKK